MGKHTKEPWRVVDGNIAIIGRDDDQSYGMAMFIAYMEKFDFPDEFHENARRIVACVNACRGLPTDELEQKGLVAAVGTQLLAADDRAEGQEREIRRLAGIASDAENQLSDVLNQRDELLAALDGVLAIIGDSEGVAGYHLNGDIADWGEFDEINAVYAAIAKAKGGAA